MKITKSAHAFKGYAKTYNVKILNSFNPQLQLKDTVSANENKLKKLLSPLRGFRFETTLVLVFKKIVSEDKIKYVTFYSYSKAERIINEKDINDEFKSIYTTVISNIQKSLGKDSGWIIYSGIDHNICISRYDLITRSSCIKLSKELHHPRKGLINIQNIGDNQCLKWCLVRYSNPGDRNLAKIAKAEKDFVKKSLTLTI